MLSFSMRFTEMARISLGERKANSTLSTSEEKGCDMFMMKQRDQQAAASILRASLTVVQSVSLYSIAGCLSFSGMPGNEVVDESNGGDLIGCDQFFGGARRQNFSWSTTFNVLVCTLQSAVTCRWKLSGAACLLKVGQTTLNNFVHISIDDKSQTDLSLAKISLLHFTLQRTRQTATDCIICVVQLATFKSWARGDGSLPAGRSRTAT